MMAAMRGEERGKLVLEIDAACAAPLLAVPVMPMAPSLLL